MPSSSRTTSSPVSSTRLSRLIYILIGLTTILCAYSSYRAGKSKEDIGVLKNRLSLGWGRTQNPLGHSVLEAKMNALAEALDIPMHILASAIADAMHADAFASFSTAPAAEETKEAVEAAFL